MKVLVFILTAVIAFTTASPAPSPTYKDVYWNLLTSSAKIVEGVPAARHQFPYQVSIQWRFFLLYTHTCGGALINENWVLTAAHCKLSLGSYQVVLGQLRQDELHNDAQRIAVAEFITHPNFSGGVATNDIALIRLATPAKISAAVQPIALATDSDCEAIEDTILSGWGLTSWFPLPPITLRWAQLPRITNEQCASNLIQLLETSEPLDDTMICTGSNPGKDQSACSGDSGGPLVKQSNGKLIGITSWGVSPCGTHGAPTVYTKVCSHLDFINKHVHLV